MQNELIASSYDRGLLGPKHAERGHLIAHVHNKQMKSSIKPFIVRTKKVSKALRKKLVQWIMKILNVRQYPITCDTLLIADADTKVKRRVSKLIL